MSATDGIVAPEAAGEQVQLRNGAVITIRAIQPGDAELITRGFARLSEESRRRRFLTPIDHLDDARLAYLTQIDHRDHEALGALGPNGEPLGVARYVRRIDDPQTAEVAVAVVDDWQRLGVATALLLRLVERARANGIERFDAAVLPENLQAVELLDATGAVKAGDGSPRLLEFEVDLTDAEHVKGRAREILRHAALRLFSLAQPSSVVDRPG
jgi:RimJ/RimL family protein N-acetyltransferase